MNFLTGGRKSQTTSTPKLGFAGGKILYLQM